MSFWDDCSGGILISGASIVMVWGGEGVCLDGSCEKQP